MPAVTTQHEQPYNALNATLYDCEDFPAQAVGGCVSSILLRTIRGKLTQSQHVAQRDLYTRCIMSIYMGAQSSTAKAVDRVYRLLDISLNAVDYILVNGEPESPAIIPNNLQYSESVRGKLEDIKQAILNQASSGELDDDMLAELAKIAVLLV